MVEQKGLNEGQSCLLLLYPLHILLWDVAAWFTLWVFGSSFLPLLLCTHCFTQFRLKLAGCSVTLGLVILQHLYGTTCYIILQLAT